MRSIILLSAIPLSAILAGCAASLEQPQAGAPSATVKFVAGNRYFTEVNAFAAFHDSSCISRSAFIASFSGSPGKEKEVKVFPDKRFYVRGTADIPGAVSPQYTAATDSMVFAKQKQPCVHLESFVPEAGHHYEITQNFNKAECPLVIRDKATNAAPPSLTAHKMTPECEKN